MAAAVAVAAVDNAAASTEANGLPGGAAAAALDEASDADEGRGFAVVAVVVGGCGLEDAAAVALPFALPAVAALALVLTPALTLPELLVVVATAAMRRPPLETAAAAAAVVRDDDAPGARPAPVLFTLVLSLPLTFDNDDDDADATEAAADDET